MTSIIRLLKIIFIRSPLEFLIALIFMIFGLILNLLAVLIAFWEWFLRLWKTKNFFQEDKEKACRGLPEALIRRPDPCIYSQTLLMAQGLPVTWNNPDIWVARADQPNNIEPDSYHLLDNTDYLVTVQVHNASTDLALGVKVRLHYRPWSFNSPELVPVETDALGYEVFHHVDIMPMDASRTTFHWHTPIVSGGFEHFCLQASVYHPLDTNFANNMGQENTNVYSRNPGHIEPGELLQFEVPLHNTEVQPQMFTFTANRYQIDGNTRHKLHLQVSHGYAAWQMSRRLANLVPILRDFTREGKSTIHRTVEGSTPSLKQRSGFTAGQIRFGANQRLRAIKTKYSGFNEIRKEILNRDISLPANMSINIAGHPLDIPLHMDAGEVLNVPISFKVPDDIPRSSQFHVNLIAKRADGCLVGGVTLLLKIKE